MRLALFAAFFAVPAGAETITADIWADNWFALNVNGRQVMEDSVPITTERSFNAESFRFDAERPFVLALMAKDFKENDTGLEYIGSGRQQMGDGGVIAQFQTNGGTVATNADWRCLVVHEAPLDPSCAAERNPVAGEGACGFRETAIPAGWDMPGFDDSNWGAAIEWSERDVSPKDGYDRITWDRAARLIWTGDLERHNTVICRIEVR